MLCATSCRRRDFGLSIPAAHQGSSNPILDLLADFNDGATIGTGCYAVAAPDTTVQRAVCFAGALARQRRHGDKGKTC